MVGDDSPMLHVWKASGDELAAVPMADVSDVRALKRHLQKLCGHSRFRQRLLLCGEILADEARLTSASDLDLQLVLMPFAPANAWQVRQLTARVATYSSLQVEELLLRPQDPNLVDIWGNVTPLLTASQRNRPQIAHLLLEATADPNFSDDLGKTPLSIACESGLEEMVSILLDAGADTEKPDICSRTPLWFASFHGFSDIARLLLAFKADKDALDDNGGTPLLVASQRGFVEVVRLLLDAGADKNATDNDGSSPATSARKYGHEEILRLLSDDSTSSSEISPRLRKRPVTVLKRSVRCKSTA